jgi:phage shock protein A
VSETEQQLAALRNELGAAEKGLADRHAESGAAVQRAEAAKRGAAEAAARVQSLEGQATALETSLNAETSTLGRSRAEMADLERQVAQ